MPRTKTNPQRVTASEAERSNFSVVAGNVDTEEILSSEVRCVRDDVECDEAVEETSNATLSDNGCFECVSPSDASEELQRYLDDYSVIIGLSVGNQNEAMDGNPLRGLLGEMELGLRPDLAFQDSTVADVFATIPKMAFLYASEIPDRSMLYFEWPDQPIIKGVRRVSKGKGKEKRKTPKGDGLPTWLFRVVPVIGSPPLDLLKVLEKPAPFRVELVNFSPESFAACIRVYLKDHVLRSWEHDDGDGCSAVTNSKLFRAFEYFFNIPTHELTDVKKLVTKKQNIDGLYRAVKDYHRSRGDFSKHADFDVQHETLLPKLRPYQADAVRWMLAKEGFFGALEMSHHDPEELHPLWVEVKLLDGITVYYQPTIGSVTLKKPTSKPMPRGGILADEMGLGKTVEILALMLMHRRPASDTYKIAVSSLSFCTHN